MNNLKWIRREREVEENKFKTFFCLLCPLATGKGQTFFFLKLKMTKDIFTNKYFFFLEMWKVKRKLKKNSQISLTQLCVCLCVCLLMTETGVVKVYFFLWLIAMRVNLQMKIIFKYKKKPII